ncbi:APC family permease [Acidicapsa dinghuensis]|uniref:APC family permease n=1 Tax=Acidicapsa dinghuensis TaxID=2218256 RepID=A0ABW1ELJ2_9BACT|nr:APC family permease [Acidicapsa dinghuensis]
MTKPDAAAKVYSSLDPDSEGEDRLDKDYGLHKGVLSAAETLAQSISAIAPSTTPSLTIPLVFSLAGNGTWFVYFLTMLAMLLVGYCVSKFARMSASPGSLYTYTADTLWPSLGAVSAWALLLAYLATGASVAGGALYYCNVLLNEFAHWTPPSVLVLAVIMIATGAVAYRDVKLSAEAMLWIEIVSVSLIAIVLILLPSHSGWHLDVDQLRLKGVKIGALGPALVLATFSFVGFESATTLGAEAREPLKTIPRVVLQCALLVGLFFMLCSYAEVLGFQGEIGKLSESTSPFHVLARKAGLSVLGTAIDIGVLISMSACTLACTTAASRVMLRMAHSGLLPDVFGRGHKRFGTPRAGVILCSAAMLAVTGALAICGVSGSNIYEWLGSISVFGFLTAYALVAIALPFARKALGQHSHFIAAVSWFAALVMAATTFGSVYPVPAAPALWFPYIYLSYMALGMAWYLARRSEIRKRRTAIS